MLSLPNTASFVPGDLRCIYLHWTAGDYETPSAAYHFCVARTTGGRIDVVATHDLRANMCDVRRAADGAYAAHTAGRNSFAIGIAVCGMRDATPDDFGKYPLREDLLAAACATAARLSAFYRIPVDSRHVRTHAEAALEDGYFGTGEAQRWDIGRLRADPRALVPREALQTADALRSRVRAERAADGRAV